MITIAQSTDYALIRQVMVDPAVYPRSIDDFCPPVEDFEPCRAEAVIYAIVRDGEELLGLFMLVPQNGIMVEIHTCLLPCAYGKRASQAALAMAQWVWLNTRCHRIITNVPTHNRLALRFALAAGMEIFGTNTGSFMYRGKLEDQIMLGLSRPSSVAAVAA